MIITKKHLPRRTFLRGMGVSLALPLLDSMVPALTAVVRTAAGPVPRLGMIYSGNGMQMPSWTPTGEGAAFGFSRTLSPLAPHRDRLLVISGLDNLPANAGEGEGVGDHSRGPATFLTGVHINKTEANNLRAGLSMDQIAAAECGKHTQLASLEVALESSDFAGMCDPGYSCAYSGTIAWRDPTTPLPMENDPRAIFERMFGADDSTDPRTRASQQRKQRSMLDSVTRDVQGLQKGLGAGDRAKLTQYLEAVRDIERRIQLAEAQSDRELPLVSQPAGIPATFEDHIRLTYDLLALAFQCDLTRVFTFMVCRELSPRTYPLSGSNATHHLTSHHQNDPEKLAALAKINTYHMMMFAEFLAKLRSTPDGEGSLLDQVMIVYGAGISDSDKHLHDNLPILLAGGGAGQIKSGRHLRAPAGTPLMNLHASLLDKMGVHVDNLGNSTGTLAELSGV